MTHKNVLFYTTHIIHWYFQLCRKENIISFKMILRHNMYRNHESDVLFVEEDPRELTTVQTGENFGNS